MKRAHLNAVLDAALLHHIIEAAGDAVGEAEDQHRLVRGTREILGAESQDERLFGPGAMVDLSILRFVPAIRFLCAQTLQIGGVTQPLDGPKLSDGRRIAGRILPETRN